MKNVIRWLDWFEKKIYWTWWLFIILAILVTYEVICRYFFNSPHDWFIELTLVITIYMAFLGCANVTKEDTHIKLDIVYLMCGKKTRKVMDYINNTAQIVVAFLIGYYSLENAAFLARNGAKHTSSLGIPYALENVAVAIGMFLIVIYSFYRMIKVPKIEEEELSEKAGKETGLHG